MSLNPAYQPISEDDYLQGELLAETKHEYIDGQVHALAGAGENHNLLSVNIATELKTRLKGTPCRIFIADMKVKVGANFFYPDVMVVCQEVDDQSKSKANHKCN